MLVLVSTCKIIHWYGCTCKYKGMPDVSTVIHACYPILHATFLCCSSCLCTLLYCTVGIHADKLLQSKKKYFSYSRRMCMHTYSSYHYSQCTCKSPFHFKIILSHLSILLFSTFTNIFSVLWRCEKLTLLYPSIQQSWKRIKGNAKAPGQY